MNNECQYIPSYIKLVRFIAVVLKYYQLSNFENAPLLLTFIACNCFDALWPKQQNKIVDSYQTFYGFPCS